MAGSDVAVIGAATLMLPLVGTVLYAFLTIQVEGELSIPASFTNETVTHQRQTTRQLGITRKSTARCAEEQLLFYLLRDNLSILSPRGLRGRVP